MPSYFLKALENTQSILCGLFIVWGHFCSRETASHRTALGFRGIFVLLEAGGLAPANDKRAKSSEKAGCPTCLPLLIDACVKGRLSPAGRDVAAGDREGGGAGEPKARLRDCKCSKFVWFFGKIWTFTLTTPPSRQTPRHLPLHRRGFGPVQIQRKMHFFDTL